MNAVIYARYSSSSQTEQSIEGQLRVCKEYAERKGYTILNEYIDRAMTGTNDNRPMFQQMILDSSKREFEIVLVYKFDRFSRSKYDNAIYKHKLQQNGVRVVSAMEDISNTPEGILMEGLLEMFAEMYSKDLSQKVKRGMRESILKGNFVGGKALYGYKVENKKLVINEEQAPAVRYMFEQYANGKSKTEIAEDLNNMGYRTNNGKKFTKKSLQQNIFKNRKYLGEYKNEYIDDKKYFPQIIDYQTFEKVQERLKHNKRFTAIPKEKFLLSGKVFCGHCGANMIGTSGTSRTGQTHAYYTCYERHKHHKCNKKNEKKKELENEVFDKVYNKILNKSKINEIADGIIKEYENNFTFKKIQELEIKIEHIEKQFDKITNQITMLNNNNIIDRLNKQANDLTEQQNIYKAEIKKLKLALQIQHTKEDIINYLNVFLEQPKDDNFKQKLFDIFISAVYVFDDYINIYFDMFNENEKISFDDAKEHKNKAEQEFSHKLQCSTS